MSDILTHFAIFENRHHIRNSLALVDPESGELIELVAEDVLLKDIDEESVAESDDLAVGSSLLPAKIKEEGGKAPVVIDEGQVQLMVRLSHEFLFVLLVGGEEKRHAAMR